MMASYHGHTIFSILGEDKAKLKSILDFIEDQMKQKHVRRFQKILSMPVPKFANSETNPD